MTSPHDHCDPYCADLPRELERIIDKCLEKDLKWPYSYVNESMGQVASNSLTGICDDNHMFTKTGDWH